MRLNSGLKFGGLKKYVCIKMFLITEGISELHGKFSLIFFSRRSNSDKVNFVKKCLTVNMAGLFSRIKI